MLQEILNDVVVSAATEASKKDTGKLSFSDFTFNSISGNSIAMENSITPQDQAFQTIKKALAPDSPIPVNIDFDMLSSLIGGHQDTISRLQPKLKKLGLADLTRYILALEGTGRINEAIGILESANAIQTDTKLMGLLADRYKRKYLAGEASVDLLAAIDWYQKAFELSITANDHKQVFYNAINLAFLFLMQNSRDLFACRTMAATALMSCQKTSRNDFRKTATMAEANLYLGEFEKSLRYYRKAIVRANYDVKVMSPMMLNAFYACNRISDIKEAEARPASGLFK